MKGYGFQIWKLDQVFPPAEQIATWKEIGVEWVCIKVRDYVNEYNRTSGTNTLADFLIACKESGIKVGTWHFIYPYNTKKQAQLISEDIRKFELDHLMIDAEENKYVGAYWKSYPKYRTSAAAKEYLDNLDLSDEVPVGLCTYRYPELHPEFPWDAFLNHSRMNMINPQVYWVGAHNPGYQLAKSLGQYRKLSQLPFYPIGAAYSEGGWEPTAKEIAEFVEVCQESFGGIYGFYRWGMAKDHPDWLAAMKVDVTPDWEPPIIPVIPQARCLREKLRIRSGPSFQHDTVGYVLEGEVVDVLEIDFQTRAEWYRIGFGQWCARRYLENVYLEDI